MSVWSIIDLLQSVVVFCFIASMGPAINPLRVGTCSNHYFSIRDFYVTLMEENAKPASVHSIISYHIISYHIISYHIISFNTAESQTHGKKKQRNLVIQAVTLRGPGDLQRLSMAGQPLVFP